ncbi:HNH endonuclease [Gordonia jacobaea]|uniref:HNH endonuclease n=1 Tax=Gordonia jacobaea TaxID=122202 RepID=UPI003A4D4234
MPGEPAPAETADARTDAVGDRRRAWNRARDRLYPLVIETYGPTCWLCGIADATTTDHVVPLSAGGHPTALSNLRPSCRPCNSARQDTNAVTYRAKKQRRPATPRPSRNWFGT